MVTLNKNNNCYCYGNAVSYTHLIELPNSVRRTIEALENAGFEAYVVGGCVRDSIMGKVPNDWDVTTNAAVYYTHLLYNGDLDKVHDLYFESAGIIITLVMLGKYLESVSKGRTSEAIKKLMALAPKTATVFRDGRELEISVEEVVVGDIVVVRPGERIPVDGEITDCLLYTSRCV